MNVNILYVAAPIVALALLLMQVALSSTEDHCVDCPGTDCLCIQDTNGCWMLSPEVGE